MNKMYNLWLKAQEIAKRKYEEEYGDESWNEADRYEREDWCFTEYERLSKENNAMVNTTTTNNATNSIKEGNDIMMNRTMTNAEVRMNKLTEAGVNVDNFFNLTLSVPFGKEVRILVDGKEMTVPTTHTMTASAIGVPMGFGVPTIIASNGDICNAETGEVLIKADDSIVQSIMDDGYVKNSKLFRRWIMAQTFRMLEYTDRRNPRRKGWEACMKDCYGFEYQFSMLKDELHTLAKLQIEDPEYFAERTKFFNGDVVVATLNDYLYRLKKYCSKQIHSNPKKYRGELYVKLARYGNVLVKDLDAKVYAPIANLGIFPVMQANADGNYRKIEKAFNDFMDKYYNKLPYETCKSATFKDAFKGVGAYYTLQNAIRFHGVILRDCNHKYDSELKLKELLNGAYKNETWRFHQLLVDTIEYNNFDLRKSIADGNKAPNTASTRANVYRR